MGTIMKTILTAAAIALTSSAALAGTVTLDKAAEGATLHEAGIDMSLYWTEAEGGFELVATYVTDETAEPARLVMLLQDGDNVTFGLPDAPDATFKFIRTGDVVVVASHTPRADLVSN
jgi:2',3'-cyclic-nucleotide 2'-phosphodiesterase (5'-nucleotidase family)